MIVWPRAGPDADDRQARAGQFRDSPHVIPCLRQADRESFFAFCGRLLPARQSLVDRLAVRQLRGVARRNVERFPFEPVGDADLDRIDRVESVEIRDRELVDAIDHRGIASRDGVEPAAAPRAAGRRAEFASHLVQHVGDRRRLRSASAPSPTRVV